LTQHDDHDAVDATDAESLVMMQMLLNSDQELITSTIQTFEYISTIKEKIRKTIRKEMIIDALLTILLNLQTSRN